MSQPLYIAFVWHMHQPYYRDLVTGECSMPWVRLHGTKDYLDMVSLLEAFPTLHQTFNLVPALLDQLEEYLPPARLSDVFLELSRKPAAELTEAEKRFLLEHFFLANWERMVKPYARYHDLFVKRGALIEEETWPAILKRFKPQDYLDLQVWFNLVWIDPWLRQQDPALAKLEAKESSFTEAEKRQVLDAQLVILQRILPAYRAAQERGQVELTTSPYYHPIVPLLCEIRNAHTALPRLPLPEVTFRHPEDARWHLRQAVARHQTLFGRQPAGLWPPEGSVSEELVQLALEAGLRWLATDEEILWRTLKVTRSPSLLYRPHLVRRAGGTLAIVFRDRELSDLIGFVYSQWKASIAIQDFLKRLEGISRQFRNEKQPALVSIILDGENAWEFYPRDGHEFLRGLYEALARDERFRVVTVSEFLERFPVDRHPSLPPLFAGSWIDGNFATWIGHPEKNAAWAHLARVRQELATTRRPPEPGVERPAALDTSSPARMVPARSQATELGGAERRSPESEARGGSADPAWRSFYVAEGSDWMWWFGDTHSSAQDEEFDRLFRTHLANVYRFLGQEAPAWLQTPIKTNVVQPVHEPTAVITPTIDGLDTSYYEWLYAGRLDLRKHYAAIHRGRQLLHVLYYGFDQTQGYFRLDADRKGLASLDRWRLVFDLPDVNAQIVVQAAPGTGATASLSGPHPQQLVCAYQQIIELAVSRHLLALQPGGSFALRLILYEGEDALERYPAHGSFRVPVPPADFEAHAWSV